VPIKKNEVSGNPFILPAELDDDRSIIAMGRRANILCLLVVGAIVWSIFAPIDELVLANGEIIPTENVTDVEHREGGIVDAVLVKEGQEVKAGDTLLVLNPIKIQTATLELKLASLNALIQGRDLDFEQIALRYPDLRDKEKVSHQARSALIEKELANLETSQALKRLEINAFENEIKSLNRQLTIEQERHESMRALYNDGHVSRKDYLDAKAALERITQSIQSADSRQQVAELQFKEAGRIIESKLAQDQKLFGQEQAALLSELTQAREVLNKQQDRVDRLFVKSPIDGIVQELAQKAIGKIVRSGELVARVVPITRQIVAEVRVDPYDIGHIKTGDAAEVNISTFDPSIFGTATGTIAVLSPTTFLTEQGDPYYKAVIDLSDNFVGEDQTKRFLQAGMLVDAKIKTGSKSLMRYMLKPVLKSFGSSFSER
jgi:adhesin transport system membrane fusion protein